MIGQAIHKQRNLSITYFDYRKALASMPHTYLLKIFQIYKGNNNRAFRTVVRCVNIVSRQLNKMESEMGYRLKGKGTEICFSYLMYMDDAKLYFFQSWCCLLYNLANSARLRYKKEKVSNLLQVLLTRRQITVLWSVYPVILSVSLGSCNGWSVNSPSMVIFTHTHAHSHFIIYLIFAKVPLHLINKCPNGHHFYFFYFIIIS